MFSKPKLPELTLPRSPSRVVKCESVYTKSDRNSAEYCAFRKCFSVLVDGITDPGRLAVQLYSEELIERDIRIEAQKDAIAERVKTEMLLSAVEAQIVASPAKFREFLDVLQNEASLQHLATRLENTHHELVNVLQHMGMQATDESAMQVVDELDAGILSSELTQVTDWKKLGINLGLPKDELHKIQHDNKWDFQRKVQMLDLWLQRTPNATWEDVVIALQKMGKTTVAESICHKYIRAEGKLYVSINTTTLISTMHFRKIIGQQVQR